MKTVMVTAAVALLWAPSFADAQGKLKTTKRAGVEAAAGTVWFDQTAGRPAISFPLGCEAKGSCLYSIWFEYVPAGAKPLFTSIFDRPPDPEDPVLEFDQCFAWVRRSPILQPMKSPGIEHFAAGSPAPSDDSMLLGAHPWRAPGAIQSIMGGNGGNAGPGSGGFFVGANYEHLLVGRWWVELTEGNCLLGFRACFHSNLKAFENRGLTCPMG